MIGKRPRNGNGPVVIDVFSGVGGFSLGASMAGFRVAAAVDTDPIALSTHARNFKSTKHLLKTARTLSGNQLLSISGLKAGELAGLIGGPPCQGFSEIGARSTTDKRNSLFAQFFRLVAETKPQFFIAENVPGIMFPQFAALREQALAHIRRQYDILEPFKVRASDYGAATSRTRVFFVGVRKSVGRFNLNDFASTVSVRVNVGAALHGLPRDVSAQWQSAADEWQPLLTSELASGVWWPRAKVPHDVGDAHALERLEKDIVSGCLGTAHMPNVRERFRKLLPGEKDSVSKASRLDPLGFCPTIRAGTGADKGSFQAVRPIHPNQPRVITPREAARLQGFPDWFVFHPTKWHSFRQIGNSVSPVVASFLLARVQQQLSAR